MGVHARRRTRLGSMPDTGLSGYRVELIRDEAAFAALEPAWRALERCCGAEFSPLRFQETWRAWVLVGKPLRARPVIVVGRCDGEAVLIWPLMRRGRTLETLCGTLSGPNDALVAADPRAGAWMAAAWLAVRREAGAGCLLLRCVPEGAALNLIGGNDGRFRTRRPTWFIHLRDWGSWEAYETHLPPRVAADQRRQWRRVAELAGDVRFRRARTREEAAAMLDTYEVLKQQWLDARGIATPLYTAAPYRAFDRANLLALFDSGQLLIGRLGSEEATLSVGYGVVRGERFVFEAFAYAREFARLSPSRLVLEQLIRWCFEKRVAVFDLTPGEDAYKRQWADAWGFVSAEAIPLGAWGRAVTAWHDRGLRRLAQVGWLLAAYRRLPRSLRSVGHGLRLPGIDYAAGSNGAGRLDPAGRLGDKARGRGPVRLEAQDTALSRR